MSLFLVDVSIRSWGGIWSGSGSEILGEEGVHLVGDCLLSFLLQPLAKGECILVKVDVSKVGVAKLELGKLEGLHGACGTISDVQLGAARACPGSMDVD